MSDLKPVPGFSYLSFMSMHFRVQQLARRQPPYELNIEDICALFIKITTWLDYFLEETRELRERNLEKIVRIISQQQIDQRKLPCFQTESLSEFTKGEIPSCIPRLTPFQQQYAIIKTIAAPIIFYTATAYHRSLLISYHHNPIPTTRIPLKIAL